MRIIIISILYTLSLFSTCFSQTTFQYDNLNRITKIDYGNGTIINYTYDANGNRLTETINSGSFVNARMVLQGFYNNYDNNLQRKDTVKGYLMNVNSPYNVVDSSAAILDTLSFEALFEFKNAPTGTYYLRIKHFNSLETWSKSGGLPFVRNNTTNYDFTKSQDMAYGNNLTEIDSIWCIHSGDINQDGFINLTDLTPVYNLSNTFLSGYTVYDVTGDNFVNMSDVVILFNNASVFVSLKRP